MNLAADKAAARELERHRQLLTQWKITTEEDQYSIPTDPPAKRKKVEQSACEAAADDSTAIPLAIDPSRNENNNDPV